MFTKLTLYTYNYLFYLGNYSVSIDDHSHKKKNLQGREIGRQRHQFSVLALE